MVQVRKESANMMKYVEPDMELIEINSEEVITSSTTPPVLDPDTLPDGTGSSESTDYGDL